MTISAPGKAFLIGEYLVLLGGPAVVRAIDRRVILRPGRESGKDLVAFARRRAAEEIGRADLGLSPYWADSSALFFEGKSLGLGSSAAVCAASVASVFAEADLEFQKAEGLRRLFEVASKVHREWQGGVGSGADVAAACFGGDIVMEGGKIWPHATIDGVRFFLVWTGRKVETREGIEAFLGLERREGPAFYRLVEEMAFVSRAFIKASRPKEVFASIKAYSGLLKEVARLTGFGRSWAILERVEAVASALSGAAKPAGAFGGDMVLLAVPRDCTEEDVTAALGPVEWPFFEARPALVGVKIEEGTGAS